METSGGLDLTPVWLTIKLAGLTVALLLLLGMPLAWWLARTRSAFKILVEAATALPLVLPPTVLGFYLLVIMGPDGPVGKFWSGLTGETIVFTFSGIVTAAMMHSLPFAVQPLKTAYEKIDRRLLEMADVLGTSPVSAFFRVILPNAVSGIAASAILAFAHTMGEFGVILMIGGSIPGQTKVASIAIYEYVEAMRYREAAILSLI